MTILLRSDLENVITTLYDAQRREMQQQARSLPDHTESDEHEGGEPNHDVRRELGTVRFLHLPIVLRERHPDRDCIGSAMTFLPSKRCDAHWAAKHKSRIKAMMKAEMCPLERMVRFTSWYRVRRSYGMPVLMAQYANAPVRCTSPRERRPI
jgi:hypothetical protein